MALSPKEERELVTKLEDMFQAAVEHPSWQEWRSVIAPKCFRYREGDQWTAAERATLKKRHQPEITNNQVAVTINRLVGQFVKQKVRTRWQGRNDKTDKAGADALSDIFLFIRQVNSLEFEERDQVEEGFTSGFGVLEVGVTWNDAYEPEITITNEDGLDIFPDPMSRCYDWNLDAKFLPRKTSPPGRGKGALSEKSKRARRALQRFAGHHDRGRNLGSRSAPLPELRRFTPRSECS